MLHRSLLALIVLPSCVVHQEEVGLDELGGARMLIGVQPASLFVEIESGAHPCPILGFDVTAILESGGTSVEVPFTARGGEEMSDETGSCVPITLRLEMPPAGDPAELVFADSTLEARIDLGGLLAAPSASLVPAGPWEIGSGHQYRVALGQRAVIAKAFSVTVSVIVGGTVVTAPAAIAGDEVVFTTPTLPASGAATLKIQVSGPQFTDWDCAPMTTSCDLVIDRKAVEVGVTLVP